MTEQRILVSKISGEFLWVTLSPARPTFWSFVSWICSSRPSAHKVEVCKIIHKAASAIACSYSQAYLLSRKTPMS